MRLAALGEEIRKGTSFPMYRVHTTASGDTMLIAQMEPGHLLNTIKLHLRTVRDTRAAIAAIDSGGVVQDPLVKALSPRTVDLSSLRAEAERKLQSTHNLVADYIMEAMLRGMSDVVTPLMQKAYGRDGQMSAIAFAGSTLFAKALTGAGFGDDDDEFKLDEPDSKAVMTELVDY